MISSEKVNAINTFIRMDQYFIDHILPHVNHSIVRDSGHYIYCVITRHGMVDDVKEWVVAQDTSSITPAYVGKFKDPIDLFDNPPASHSKPVTVIGMSLSQLDYSQLETLNDIGYHGVIKLPSARNLTNVVKTKNPLIIREVGKDWLYFVRDRTQEVAC